MTTDLLEKPKEKTQKGKPKHVSVIFINETKQNPKCFPAAIMQTFNLSARAAQSHAEQALRKGRSTIAQMEPEDAEEMVAAGNASLLLHATHNPLAAAVRFDIAE